MGIKKNNDLLPATSELSICTFLNHDKQDTCVNYVISYFCQKSAENNF